MDTSRQTADNDTLVNKAVRHVGLSTRVPGTHKSAPQRAHSCPAAPLPAKPKTARATLKRAASRSVAYLNNERKSAVELGICVAALPVVMVIGFTRAVRGIV